MAPERPFQKPSSVPWWVWVVGIIALVLVITLITWAILESDDVDMLAVQPSAVSSAS